MPVSVIVNNLGPVKVNNHAFSASIVVGDTVNVGIQSQTKNFIAGPFNAGDVAPTNNPTLPIFFDPDLIDSSSVL